MPIPRNLTASGEVVKYSDDRATVFLATILPPGGTLNVTGNLAVTGLISGAFSNNVTNVVFAQSPYTVAAADETIVVDASGGAVTINLPAALAANIGRTLYIAKTDASANGVTIQTNGGDTLNGVAGVGAILTKQLEVANIQVIAVGAWLSIAGDVTIQTVSAIDGTGGSNRDLDWLTVGSLRWQLRANNTAESGGNAGSDLNLNAYDDTGVLIGAILTAIRAAGGLVTIARPLSVTNQLSLSVTPVNFAASPYPVAAGDYTVRVDTSAGNVVVTLSTAIGATGRILNVKKVTNDANTVTINTSGGQTIDGSASVVIPGGALTNLSLQSDGANWMVL